MGDVYGSSGTKEFSTETLHFDLKSMRKCPVSYKKFVGDFRGVDLSYCDFYGCDFFGVNLRGADLTGTQFKNCRVTGMDITGANLCGLCFGSVSETGKKVFCFPEGVVGLPDAPVVPALEEQIYQRIVRAREEGKECPLLMEQWHTCKTVHCLAGWAVFLAGSEGWQLERKTHAALAGALIYQKSCGFVPDFFEMDTQKAIRDLEKRLGIGTPKEQK